MDILSEWKTAIINDTLSQRGLRVRVMFPEKSPLLSDPYVFVFYPDVDRSPIVTMRVTKTGELKKTDENRQAYARIIKEELPPDCPERLVQFDAYYKMILGLGTPPTEEREANLYHRRLEQQTKQTQIVRPDYGLHIFGRYPWLKYMTD
jgi:hypothetical protein